MGEPESLTVDEPLDRHIERHAFDRLIMLSDGVYAIAVTLAAIEIRLPDDLISLGDLWARSSSQLLAYGVSFVIIAIFWLSSRDLLARVQRVDAVLTILTLAMLCCVAVIPASTHLLYVGAHADPRFRFYAMTMMVCGLLSLAMWAYATWRPGILRPGVAETYGRRRMVGAALMPAIFGAAILLPAPLVTPVLVPLLAAFVVVRRAILPRMFRERAEASAEGGSPNQLATP